ncbi:helix-turn-helix domain-containing protein [Desulfitibacter alkalitolerans]|uniref:helix-turn-helix domain-containing protein n=1 Tax=Desulfitibacter alkalitolerans TaxID=264641 RepID=UPI00146F9644|nr:helix-turn-helix domain-containing protein [Desulfitibacter alkalitolerans]
MKKEALLISVSEARVLLGGISDSLMWKLIRNEDIKTCKIGRRRMIRLIDLEKFIQSQE